MSWQDAFDRDTLHGGLDQSSADSGSPLTDPKQYAAYLDVRQASTRKFIRERQAMRDAEAAARRYSPRQDGAEATALPEGDEPSPMRPVAAQGHPARQFTGQMPKPSPHRGEDVVVEPGAQKTRQDPVLHGIVKGADETATTLGLRNERPSPEDVLPQGSTLDSFILSPAPDEETSEERRAWVDALAIEAPKGAISEMVSTVVQFGTGMALTAPVGGPLGGLAGKGAFMATKAALGAARAQKGATALSVATGGPRFMATGALADAMAFDPDEHSGLLGQLVDGNPELEAVLQDMMLAPDPGAAEFAARVQMAVEGAAVGGAAGVVLKLGGLVFKRMVAQVERRRQGTALGGSDPATKEALRREADVAAAQGADNVARELEAKSLPGSAEHAAGARGELAARKSELAKKLEQQAENDALERDSPTLNMAIRELQDDIAAREAALAGGGAPKPAAAAAVDPKAAEAYRLHRKVQERKGMLREDVEALEEGLVDDEAAARAGIAAERRAIEEMEAELAKLPPPVAPAAAKPKPKAAAKAPAGKSAPGSGKAGAVPKGTGGEAPAERPVRVPPAPAQDVHTEVRDLFGVGEDLAGIFREEQNTALLQTSVDVAGMARAVVAQHPNKNARLVAEAAATQSRLRLERRTATLRALGRSLTPWMDDEALEVYARAERRMVDAWTYVMADPKALDRGRSLVEATKDYMQTVRDLSPEGAAALHVLDVDAGQVVEWVRGLRDQSISPYFNPLRADAVEGLTSRRVRTPQEVRAEKPPQVRATKEDVYSSAQHSASIEPVRLPDDVAARTPRYDPEAAARDPIDVWLGRVESKDDFDLIESEVGVARGLERRTPRDTRAVDEAKAVRDAAYEKMREVGERTGTSRAGYPQREAARKEFWAAEDALQKARDAGGKGTSDARWAAEQEGARGALFDLTGVRGFGFRTGRLTGNQNVGVPGRRHKLAASGDHRRQLHTLDAMASTVQRMAVAASAKGATADMRAQAASALHKLVAYTETLYGRTGKADAALAASKLPADLEGAAVGIGRRVRGHELIGRSGGSQHLDAVLAAVAMSGDTQAVMRVVGRWADDLDAGVLGREGRSMGLRQRKAAAYGYASGLLSRPSTWVRNAAGSLAFGAMRGGPEKFISRSVTGWQEDGARGAVRGMDMAAREIGASAVGVFKGLTDGFRLAALIAKRDADVLGTGGAAAAKIEENGWGALARDMLSTSRLDVDETVTYHGLPRGLRDYVGDTPFRPVGETLSKGVSFGFSFGGKGQFLSDVVVRTISYRAHLAARVAREGYGKGWTRAQADARLEELMRDPAAHREAMDNAEINSFLKEASDTPTRILLEAKAKHPEIGYVFPFVNTLSNITKESWKRVPGVKLRDRSLTPQERADLIGGQVAMAGILATGGYLLHNGTMTGTMAGQPDERSAAYRNGWRPFSFRVETDPDEVPEGAGPGPHYKYLYGMPALAGPYALPLMFGATITEAVSTASNEEQLAEAFSLADAALRLLADPVMEMTWAEGATPVAENLVHILNDEPGRATKNALRGGTEVVTNIVTPGSSLARQVEKWRLGAAGRRERSGGVGGPDETAREQVLESLQEVGRRLTDLTLGNVGLTEGGQPRINPLTGDPYGTAVPNPRAQAEAGFGHMAYSFVSPLGLSYGATSPGEKEAVRLGWNPGWPSTKVRVQVPGETDRYRFWERTPEMMAEWEPRAGKEFARLSRGVEEGWYKDKTPHEKKAQLSAWMARAREDAWAQVSSLDRFRDEVARMNQVTEDVGLVKAQADRDRERMAMAAMEAG